MINRADAVSHASPISDDDGWHDGVIDGLVRQAGDAPAIQDSNKAKPRWNSFRELPAHATHANVKTPKLARALHRHVTIQPRL
jgi:hypothetical protein